MPLDFSCNSCSYIFTKDAFFSAKSKKGLVQQYSSQWSTENNIVRSFGNFYFLITTFYGNSWLLNSLALENI